MCSQAQIQFEEEEKGEGTCATRYSLKFKFNMWNRFNNNLKSHLAWRNNFMYSRS
jgi:hypothetical protein